MKPLLFSLILWTSVAACNLVSDAPAKKTSKEMTYSYACMDTALVNNKTNKAVRRTTDVLTNLAVNQKAITDDVQNRYGEDFHKDAIESKTFVLMDDTAAQAKLTKVMTNLLAVREDPSKIDYRIYLLLDKEINAFTFGGRIYVTKAMYDRCKGSEALLYSIVGHEIGHSERGHIKKTIQEMMLSDKLFGGENGDLFLYVKQLLTSSFNQRNELEADYYGTDLTYRLNQDVCSAVTFWKEMAKDENGYSKLEDFFRTHPFSSLRATCLKDHIEKNFGVACGK